MPVVKGNLSSAGYTTFWAARNRSDALWISSLTDEAIRKGLEELKDGSEYDSLYAAADSRAKADWLVGMNASRALAIVSGLVQQLDRTGADSDARHDMQPLQGEPQFRIHTILAAACHP